MQNLFIWLAHALSRVKWSYHSVVCSLATNSLFPIRHSSMLVRVASPREPARKETQDFCISGELAWATVFALSWPCPISTSSNQTRRCCFRQVWLICTQETNHTHMWLCCVCFFIYPNCAFSYIPSVFISTTCMRLGYVFSPSKTSMSMPMGNGEDKLMILLFFCPLVFSTSAWKKHRDGEHRRSDIVALLARKPRSKPRKTYQISKCLKSRSKRAARPNVRLLGPEWM